MDKEKNKNTNTGSGNTVTQNTSSGNVTEQTSQLVNIRNDVSKITSLVTTITATGIEEVDTNTVMKEYHFITPMGKRETLKTFDTEIIKSTERIGAALAGQKILTFVVCRELARLNNKETLLRMGFKTISEYGKALFGFQKATCNMYAKVGKIFIGDDYNLKSKVLPSSLTVGHLIELTSYVGEDDTISEIEKAYISGELTDGLSTAKLRQALKETFKAIESTATETETTETTGSAGTTVETETTETTGTAGTTVGSEITGTAGTTEKNPLVKESAKLFSATIFIKDFVKEHFSSDKDFTDGIIEMLSVLEESTKALLVEKPE